MQYKNLVGHTIFFGVSIVFLASLSFPFHQASANVIMCDPLVGICSDPFSNVEQSIQQHQSQIQAYQQGWQQIQNKESAMKSQYGYDAYVYCTRSSSFLYEGDVGRSNILLMAAEPCMANYKPTQEAGRAARNSCMQGGRGVWTPYAYGTAGYGGGQCQCNSGQLINGTCVTTIPTCTANSTYDGSQCICNAGYTSLSGTCLSNKSTASALDSSWRGRECVSSFGSGSIWNGSVSADYSTQCACSSGYSWNSSNTACVLNIPAPATTPTCDSGLFLRGIVCVSGNQACINDFGVHTVASGKLNSNGGPVCDCTSGFVWEGKTCVTPDQSCQSIYGTYSTWTGEKNSKGGLMCGCKDGYNFNSANTTCVKTKIGTTPIADLLNIPALDNGSTSTPTTTSIAQQKGFFSRLLHALNPFSWF